MYTYRLSNELARRGHRVTVVHCVDAYYVLRADEPRGTFPHHPNVTVLQLRSRWGGLSPLVTYLSGRPGLKAPALNELFARQQFDVTHFHNVSLIGGPGILSYGSGLKLYTMHEHWLVCPMHVLWKDNREVCEKPSCLRCTLAFRRPPQLWRYTGALDRQLDQVDLFLSPSHFTELQHRRRGFTRPIRHLPHFLSLAQTNPSDPAAPPPSGRPYFLFVGRLEKMKGVQTLIGRFRTYDLADLIIAGDGAYSAALRARAAGLAPGRLVGRVHPPQLRGLYAKR